jgi:hypothetical protein
MTALSLAGKGTAAEKRSIRSTLLSGYLYGSINATYCSDKIRPPDGARVLALMPHSALAVTAAIFKKCCVRSMLLPGFIYH